MNVWTKKVWALPVGFALALPAASFAQQQTPAPDPNAPKAMPDGGPDHPPMRVERHVEIRHMDGEPQMREDHKVFFLRSDAPGPMGMHGEHGEMMGMDHGMGMHHQHMEFWKNPEMVKRLALTPEQVKKLDAMKEASEIEAIHLRAAVEEQGVRMRSLMESATFDQKATDLAIDKMADARAALEKAEAKARVSERAVLTPDQWTKLHTPPEHHMMQPGMWQMHRDMPGAPPAGE